MTTEHDAFDAGYLAATDSATAELTRLRAENKALREVCEAVERMCCAKVNSAYTSDKAAFRHMLEDVRAALALGGQGNRST